MALNLSRNTSVFVSTGNGVHASGGSVANVDGFTGGSGHAVGDVITCGTTSGTGVGLKVVVSAVNSGAVTAVTIPNNFRGRLFADNETAAQTATTGTGTGFACVVKGDGVDVTSEGGRLPTGLFKGNGTDANTFKIGVLDGYSFSQGSDATDITISEAGAEPNRGSKRFNDSLPPAEWSFGTYVRPFKHGTNSHRSSGTMDMVENILWAAIAGKDITGGSESGTSATAVTCDGTDADVSFARSDHHELLKLSIFFALENTTYRLNECQVNQAEIDFSIDGIATITWSGNATTIDQVTTAIEDPSKALISTDGTATVATLSTYIEGYNYVDTTAPNDADYLRNKLSTLSLTHAKNSAGVLEVGATDSTTTYDINITGGSLTIANNITYVTPETLGLVDVPVGSFSGARQISGSLTMYLDTKANGSNVLLSDLTAATDLVNNAFDMSLFMGGGSSSVPVVEFDLPKAHLQIPTIETADIISTTVEFAAQGTDLLTGDEMTVKYKGLTSHSDSAYTTDVTV